MNQPRRNTPFALMLFLLLLGVMAAIPAFWLITHPRALPGSGLLITASFALFFISWSGALLIYLHRRAQNDTAQPTTDSSPPLSQPNLQGTVYGLMPGHQYRILQSFTDYYGNTFEQGQLLRFKERHFLPYEGGHTIVFHERSLYLQEDRNSEILEKFSEYISQII